MPIEERYRQAYNVLEETAKRRTEEERYTVLGYASNLDLLCDFNVDQLNRLLAEHMPDARLTEMKVPDAIWTMEDMLSTVVYYAIRGIGGEADVENVELVRESFRFDYGMGGTSTQAAMALAKFGCPSVVHLTDNSKEVCDILESPPIYTVSQSGELIHADEVVQRREPEIHFIIQFKKGDLIKLGEQEEEIPCSNRLILTKITINQDMPFFEPYFHWVENNAVKVSSNVLSGFNALFDMETLKERLDYIKNHVKNYRKNNPEGIVFLEDAHYHDYEVRKLCLQTICPCVDVISLNEEELQYTLMEMCGYHVDTDNIFSCVEGAKLIREEFGVRRGTIVHTKDYSMYVGEQLKANIEQGLMYGNMFATAKAMNGWYGDLEHIEAVMRLELSPKGVAHYEEVYKSCYADEVVLVPSKYIDKPKYTIGLGDSFLGGVQLCF